MASVNWVLLLWARKVVLLTFLWKMMKVPIARPLLQLLPLTVKFQDPDLLDVEAEASLVISLRESQLGLEIVHLEEWSLREKASLKFHLLQLCAMVVVVTITA